MLTLYHGRTSVCSIKARLALAEKGVEFESRLMTLRGDQFDPGLHEAQSQRGGADPGS